METMINIKTKRDLKIQAQKIADSMGLTLSSVLNNYLRKFVEEGQITFTEPLMPNAKTAAILRQALRDTKNGKNMIGPFKDVKSLIKGLKKQ